MTQIQLEHIRKLTFIPDKKSSGSLLLDLGLDADEGEKAAEETTFAKPPATPHIQFKKYASGCWSVESKRSSSHSFLYLLALIL